MLRTVITQHRIGEMALEELRAPAFPLSQKGYDLASSIIAAMPLQQPHCGGWRAGAAVEPDHGCFAAREQLVKDREITYNNSNKAKPCAGLQNRDRAGGPGMRNEIPVADGKERDTAHIELIAKARRWR